MESGFCVPIKIEFLSILGQLKAANSLIDKQHSGLKLISVISVNRAVTRDWYVKNKQIKTKECQKGI